MANGDDTKSQDSQVDIEGAVRVSTNFDIQNNALHCVRGEGERLMRNINAESGEFCRTVFDELNDRIEAGERLYEGREDSPPLTTPQVPQAAARFNANTQGVLDSGGAGATSYYIGNAYGRTNSLPDGITLPDDVRLDSTIRSIDEARSACVGNRVSGVAGDGEFHDLAPNRSTPIQNCTVIGYSDGLEDGATQLTSVDPDIDGPNATPSTGGRNSSSIGGRQ
tara:strand:- start:109 stop:777 length:669 start_codon:yes stop_codon:yes gene_type:complete